MTDAHLYSQPDHKFDVFLASAVDKVMAMKPLPDFLVYCGDIAQERRDDQLKKGIKLLSKLTLEAGFAGTMQYDPFDDMLTPEMKNGFSI